MESVLIDILLKILDYFVLETQFTGLLRSTIARSSYNLPEMSYVTYKCQWMLIGTRHARLVAEDETAELAATLSWFTAGGAIREPQNA